MTSRIFQPWLSRRCRDVLFLYLAHFSTGSCRMQVSLRWAWTDLMVIPLQPSNSLPQLKRSFLVAAYQWIPFPGQVLIRFSKITFFLQCINRSLGANYTAPKIEFAQSSYQSAVQHQKRNESPLYASFILQNHDELMTLCISLKMEEYGTWMSRTSV